MPLLGTEHNGDEVNEPFDVLDGHDEGLPFSVEPAGFRPAESTEGVSAASVDEERLNPGELTADQRTPLAGRLPHGEGTGRGTVG